MQTIYGSSVPPGLTAPTRGEMKIRIERLQLHHETLIEIPAVQPYLKTMKSSPEAADEVTQYADGITSDPVELKALLDQFEANLVVVPLFWGESPTVHSAECQPVTDALSDKRTVITIICPIKTLQSQLVQYLHHSAMSPLKGLPLRLVLPAVKVGKRQAVEIGAATINMSALGPTTPISGWFAVVGQNAKGELSGIGRLKVHVSVNFYNSANSVDSGNGADTAAGKKLSAAPKSTSNNAPSRTSGKQLATGTTKSQQSESANPLLASNGLPDVGRPPLHRGQTPPQQPLSGVRQPRKVSLPHNDFSSSASSNTITSHGGTYPLSSSGGEATLTDDIASNVTTHQLRPTIEHRKLDDIFSKFQHLRDELSLAAGRSELPSGNFASEREDHQLSDLYRRHVPGLSAVAGAAKGFTAMGTVSMPIGIEHRMNGDRPPHNDFLMDGSLDGDEADIDDDDEEDSAAELEDATAAADVRQVSAPLNQKSPPRHFNQFNSEVYLTLTDFAFTDVVDEIRIQLRLSKDVSCPTPFEALSSFVYYLPPATAANVQSQNGQTPPRGISIPLHFTVSSFTSESRLVVECYSVHSKPAGRGRTVESEELVGVMFLGLYTAAPRAVKFHDPITGRNPVEAVAEVRVFKEGTADRTLSPMPSKTYPTRLADQRNNVSFDSHSYADHPSNQTPVLSATEDKPKLDRDTNRVEKSQRHKNKRSSKLSTKSSKRRYSSSSSSTDASGSSYTSSDITSDESDVSNEDRRSRRSQNKVVIYSDTLSNQTTVTINTTKPEERTKSTPQAIEQQPQPTRVTASKAVAAQELPSTRLHVTLKQAKSLPQVQIKGLGDGVDLFGATGSGAVTLHPTSENGSVSPLASATAPPHTFLVIEDFIFIDAPNQNGTSSVSRPSASFASSDSTVVPNREGDAAPSTSFRDFLHRLEERDKSPTNGGGTLPATADWYVDGVVRGHFDRTLVADSSCKPQFNYEASITIAHPPTTNGGGSAVAHLPLSGMLVSVWHAQPDTFDSEHHTNTAKGDGDETERRFWSRACRIGTAFVDLKGLKYLPTAEGWYRCYSDHHCIDTPVGYIQASVRRL